MSETLPFWRSLRGRVYAVLGVAIVLGFVLSAVAFADMNEISDLSEELADTSGAHSIAQDLAVGLADLEFDLDTFLVMGHGTARATVEADVAFIESTLDELRGHSTSDSAMAERIGAAVAATDALSASVERLIATETLDAGAMNRSIVALYSELDATRALYNDINRTSLAGVEAAVMEQRNILGTLGLRVVALRGAVVLILLGVAVVLGRSLRSIGKVTDTALAIAAGDLDRDVDVVRHDEIGLLAGAFRSMTAQLRDSIESLEQRVAKRTAQLSSTNEQLQDEVKERQQAEEALRVHTAQLETALQDLGKAQAQLLQAQKMEAIGGLAAGVAHEINTPIQYVSDNALFLQETFDEILELINRVDLIASGLGDDPLAESVAELRAALDATDVAFLEEEVPTAIAETIDGVKRIAEIVRAVKEFSQPGNQETRSVDINRLVTSTTSLSKNEWKYVADLELDLAQELAPIDARPGPLGQALLILIINAAEAIARCIEEGARDKGTITVKTAPRGADVVVEVMDTGCGIPEDIQHKVFEHFFTTKDVGQGSGQGLSIAHSIVTSQHDGEMTFETVPGEGTTFQIRLPRAEVEESDAA